MLVVPRFRGITLPAGFSFVFAALGCRVRKHDMFAHLVPFEPGGSLPSDRELILGVPVDGKQGDLFRLSIESGN